VNVRKPAAFSLAIALFGVPGWMAPAADKTSEARSDTQLRAMLDELARSRTLQLNNLDKPYFIQYSTGDADEASISASLGGITASSRMHLRHPAIEVRIGDYKFDNTNSVFTGNTRLGLLPIDDDYQAMRTDLWLTTDALYKAATEQITHKRTALREIAEPDKTPDFSPATALEVIQPAAVMNFDQKHWEDVARQVSRRFAAHPAVLHSRVFLRSIASTYRLVNTEGSIVRIPQRLTEIEIESSALAPDGDRVWDHQFITVPRPSEFPKEQDLAQAAESVAAETEALAKAPLADDYSGPVLFEQEAGAELMASALTDAIRLQRKPLAPPGGNNAGSQTIESVWAARVGSKVMPDWLSVYDNPDEQQFHGAVLAGHYQVDDEGVPAQRVLLVDKGVLKGFLFSREPIGQFAVSNGHGRLPGGWGTEAAVIGNLFVHADQAQTEARLKSMLLEKVKAAGLKYGVIVRRLDFPSTANFQELQSIARQLQKNGYARTLNPPLLAYRVYPDGREELVRGWRFGEFSAKDLRDVDAASDHSYVLNYVNNGSSFNLANAGSDATTSSVICPSLLFDSVDLARAEEENGKLPIVPPPALTP
jgi:predicted Zn-dependent protease